MADVSTCQIDRFPAIDTVANPAVYHEGMDVFICYEIAPVGGGGAAVLHFADIIDFRINPMNVDGLSQFEYPVEPWSFTEIIGTDRTEHWKALDPRFWAISFRDLTVEIVFFGEVRKIFETREALPLKELLLRFVKEPPEHPAAQPAPVPAPLALPLWRRLLTGRRHRH